jgi:hypothetical protein
VTGGAPDRRWHNERRSLQVALYRINMMLLILLGLAEAVDDATLAPLARQAIAIKLRIFRLTAQLPPPEPEPAASASSDSAFEVTDDELRWRIDAGLSGAGPPRPKNAEPRGRLLETPAAGLEALGQSGCKHPDNRKLSTPDASAAYGSEDFCAWRPIGEVLAELRVFRKIAALNRLGDRVAYEFWARVGRERMLRTYLENLLDEFLERLTPELLALTGGDQPLPAPLHAVRDLEDQEGEE